MKRKDLYVEIYNTVLTEVHIADRDTLTEILESLSIYKFTDAFSSLLPSLNGDKSYLKNFVEKIKDCSNDPNIDLEEEIDNPFDFASFEMVEASRKVHLHKFYHYNIDCIIVTSKCLYYDNSKKFTDAILWEAIEKLWKNILDARLSKNNFFSSLKNLDDDHFFILKTAVITATDSWRIYSEAYFEKVINNDILIPEELKYIDSALCTGLSPDWNKSYEQYHDSFNIIADMRNANDLLTRFLKMYQVLEFFTFRLKLIPLTKGQATRNSFISNVRHTVDTISKGELKSLQDLFAKVFNSIHNTEVKNLVEPIQTNNIKLSKYLNQTLTRQIKSILGLTNQNISNPSNVAELIYKIRCCIVHSKESEIHFTPNNISEYKDLIPVMRVLIKVIQNSIVETINNSGKKDLEFQSESMLLY